MTSEVSAAEQAPKVHKGWTYPGVIIISSIAMILLMAIDVKTSGDIGLISNIGIVIIGMIAALKVRTPDYLAAIWVVPIAWIIALLTSGQLAPKLGGSVAREQILSLAYGLAMHAGWVLGATAIAAGIAIFRRGRQP